MLATRSLARLTATLSFAYVIRGQLLGVPFTFLELCILATLLAYVVEKRRAGEGFPDPRRMVYFWPLALLLVAATISIFVAPDQRAAAGIWRAYFLEPMLFAYVVADVMRAPWHLDSFVAGFFWSGIVVSAIEVVTFLYAVAVGRPHLVDDPVVAIYLSANATGLFLGPLLAMAAAFILFGHPIERTRAIVFAVLVLPAFILSFSRGAWLALVVAVLFLAWQHRARLVIFGGVALALVAGLLVPPLRQRLAHQFDPNDPLNSINLRRNLWRATIDMQSNLRHAIFGTGLSGFKHDIEPYKAFAGYSENLIYPHNIFLNFWTETGILGLGAFCWLAVQWVRTTWQTVKVRGRLRPYYLAVAAASITFLVHGLLDVPFFKNDLALLTLSVIAIQVAALRQDGGAATGKAAVALAA
ncbi:MAG: O-antigen ligase family protein [Candidatus Dormiibacterota bacterium]